MIKKFADESTYGTRKLTGVSYLILIGGLASGIMAHPVEESEAAAP
jgi:hypothetical protein